MVIILKKITSIFVKSIYMLKLFSKILLISKGWTYDIDLIKPLDKCVLIVAPHTSAWDFVLGLAVFTLEDVPVRFAVKKEAFFFPSNLILKYFGALPIDRTPKNNSDKKHISLVEALVKLIEDQTKIAMVITPEGSRSKRKNWKTGFYYVALNAKVPIALSHLDFETKEAMVGKIFYPTGDLDKDMREIMNYYKDKTHVGKYPNRCTIDERWA